MKAMSSSEKDSFSDKFALYLAVGLLGHSRVIEYLNDDERREQPAVPLYWRSKLMIPDPSRMLYHAGEKQDTASKTFPLARILFFDASFKFVRKENHPEDKDNKSDSSSTQRPSSSRIVVSLGFFLLRQNRFEATSEDWTGVEFDGGHYISTQALDYEQIMSYVDSLQLDRESVAPETLAESMAEEFLRQGSPSGITSPEERVQPIKIQQVTRDESATSVTIENSPDCTKKEENGEMKHKTSPNHSQNFDDFSSICDVCAIIPCKNMGDSSGKLMLRCSPKDVTKFDGSALRFLSWDLSKNPNHYENLPKNGESLLYKKDLVDDAFDRWRIKAESSVIGDNHDSKPDTQSLANGTNHSVSTSTVNSNGTKTNDKPKKRRYLKGMGILPSARRKRNKGLVYDK